MGADGGSIPRREELVKVKAKAEKADPKELERIKWSICSISKQPLKEPIVACFLGNLYNKEVVLKHLIEKTMPETFSHIRSLKDTLNLQLKANPLFVSDSAEEVPKFICPITAVEVGKNYKFVANKNCGCVLSERAVKECPSEVCMVCNKPTTMDDYLKIHPEDEEREKMKEKHKNASKKIKKRKKDGKEKEVDGTKRSKKGNSASEPLKNDTIQSKEVSMRVNNIRFCKLPSDIVATIVSLDSTVSICGPKNTITMRSQRASLSRHQLTTYLSKIGYVCRKLVDDRVSIILAALHLIAFILIAVGFSIFFRGYDFSVDQSDERWIYPFIWTFVVIGLFIGIGSLIVSSFEFHSRTLIAISSSPSVRSMIFN
ncbi:hypothetical protein PROFUN_09584 [Planoprotostelium fungivorum]|uniref:Uncharacterized protein n=1 Tax=Planoprotostelium fungivorum TaxID=1890364 RepID=A0A2P6NGR6_9EUKA|nr:hypothetical protein PROFUN_09584 [Planoprotostelium fungivorum]